MRYVSLLFILIFAISCSTASLEYRSNAQSGKAAVNGVEIYYEIYGSGDPLILLHGGFHDVTAWRNQIPELSKHFQVIAVDSRGHGASTFDDQPFSYELLTSDIIALMDYLKIDQADVVGWSDGAVVAIQMGIYHPSRIKHAVLIGATVQYEDSLKPLDQWVVSQKTLFKLYANMTLSKYYKDRNPRPKDWPQARDKVYNMWRAECYFPIRQGEDCLQQMARIKAPMLILVGEKEMIRKEHAEAIHNAIPNSKLITIEHANHFVMMQKPQEVNQAILDFLQ
jgi:pimeloyl-ACP methyl ester carboxylesterase